MKAVEVCGLLCAFALGACASTAIRSASGSDEPEPIAATVLNVADVPMSTAPSGKAKIAHLARGVNAYLGRLEIAAGGKVPEHRDATEEYLFVLEGGGTVTIDDVEHPIRAGSAIYMPANAKVSYVNGDTKSVVMQVFAGPAPASKYDAWK